MSPPNGEKKKKKPDFLALCSAVKNCIGGVCFRFRELTLLLKSGTLRIRCGLRARVEIFQPRGQRSAVCCYQMQSEVDQSPQWKIFLLADEKM